MCLGAMVHARIGGLVFGARDAKAGIQAYDALVADAGFDPSLKA